MNREELNRLLTSVSKGEVTVEEAELQLRKAPYEDLGYAKVDRHRGIRQGVAEVIYGAGKTPEQIAGIAGSMAKDGEKTILITRIDREKFLNTQKLLGEDIPITYYETPKAAVVGKIPEPTAKGTIVVATGGTSDLPVSEEAALTAEVLGNRVVRLTDVGVAGLHRLLSHMDELLSARVIICCAGMEGALSSVIGGLVDCPIIAVPTSVGYGASFGGLSALLSMLNSCASGVSVVNIDNGFGAGYQASMINHLAERE